MAYTTHISNTTQNRRALIKSLQDEFTSFSWGGVDAFETFGAFILNDKKGSLKFYNGPGFSNEYTKPQFDNAGGSLQGVSFNKQTISFSIGVYWISIEDYRQLLNWLSPLKIDYLQFGFEPDFRYDVKLSKVGDSTRWIVGRENGKPRYYTELSLSFEVQGTPCAKGVRPYEFRGSKISTALSWNFTGTQKKEGVCYLYKPENDFIPSDLETPVKINFTLNLEADYLKANYMKEEDNLISLAKWNDNNELLEIKGSSFVDDSYEESDTEYEIKLWAAHNEIKDGQKTEIKVNLLSMTLQNVTIFQEKGYKLHFSYISETGLVFLRTDEVGSGGLLTLQTYTDTGDFLVKNLQTTKFMLPGEFQYPEFYNEDLKFILEMSKRSYENNEWKDKIMEPAVYEQVISIECYPRTNVI